MRHRLRRASYVRMTTVSSTALSFSPTPPLRTPTLLIETHRGGAGLAGLGRDGLGHLVRQLLQDNHSAVRGVECKTSRSRRRAIRSRRPRTARTVGGAARSSTGPVRSGSDSLQALCNRGYSVLELSHQQRPPLTHTRSTGEGTQRERRLRSFHPRRICDDDPQQLGGGVGGAIAPAVPRVRAHLPRSDRTPHHSVAARGARGDGCVQLLAPATRTNPWRTHLGR